MKMRLRALWLLAIALVAGAVLMAMAAQATPSPVAAPTDQSTPQQPPPPPRGPGGPGGPDQIERLVFGLDLSATQIDQIKALSDQQRSDSQAYQEQMKQVRDNLRAVVGSGTFDENAVRALANAEAKAQIELTVIRVRTEVAVYQLLNADQRTKLMDLLKNPPRPR